MGDPDPQQNAKALALAVRALERYPAPMPLPVEGGPMRYHPALDVTMTIYVERFESTEEEETIKAAFAAIVPKVLERCQRFYETILDAIVDGGRLPEEVQADYMNLMHELSILAAVFAGPPRGASADPYASQYAAMCETIQGLMEIPLN